MKMDHQVACKNLFEQRWADLIGNGVSQIF
jgi:hypothetical protein